MKALKVILVLAFLGSGCFGYGQDTIPGLRHAMDDFNKNNYPDAARELEALLPEIEKKYGSKDTVHFIRYIVNAAISFQRSEQFSKAEYYYRKGISFYESIHSTRSNDYLNLLQGFAEFYKDNGRYEPAEKVVEKALHAVEALSGKNSLRYAYFLNLRGTLYRESGSYDQAEDTIRSAIEIAKFAAGEYHPAYVAYLENLAATYESTGQSGAAQTHMVKVLVISSQILDKNGLTYAFQLNHLAAIYNGTGQFDKAETLIKQALSILKSRIGENTAVYADVLCNLGITYQRMGNYRGAEQVYGRTIELAKETIGENAPDYAVYLNWLSTLYRIMGRYREAEELMNKCLDIIEYHYGDSYRYYSTLLTNLAQLYLAMNNYEEAELTLQRAITRDKKVLGENNPNYAWDLYTLSQLYVTLGKYDLAEPLILRSIEISNNVQDENLPRRAMKLNTLGFICYATGRLDRADSIYRAALAINQDLLGQNHTENAGVYHNLALLSLAKNNDTLVREFMENAFRVYCYQIEMNTGYLSAKEAGQFFDTFLEKLDNYQALNFRLARENFYCGDFSYDIELTRKCIQLQSAITVKNRILNNGDTNAISSYYELLELRRQIEKMIIADPEKRVRERRIMEQQANDLEKELAIRSQDYRSMMNTNAITWRDVRKNLKPGEAAIEFAGFHYFDGKTITDTTLYSAIVLRESDTIPRIIYLCNEAQLMKAIPPAGSSPLLINEAYGGKPGGQNRDDDPQVRSLSFYNLIWEPLDTLLTGISTVYFAPSGSLNSISMAAIPCPGNKVLMEKYDLVQLVTTRTLAVPAEEEAIRNAAVYGGIFYDMDSVLLKDQSARYRKKYGSMMASGYSTSHRNRNGFRYLPGTKTEAEMIAARLLKNGIPTAVYSGTEASEESFIALSGSDSPSLIHLSTHGYYYPDTVPELSRQMMKFSTAGEEKFRFSEDPLLRSGLLLAGANISWKGLRLPDGVEDGILTAKEVSNLNLGNTRLVVLSACQTGKGDVRGSEGVEGLQRGFKMAGVQQLVLSLWAIPDKETLEFMVLFYEKWLGGKEIPEAFRAAQMKMRSRYRDEPFKWGAFALVR